MAASRTHGPRWLKFDAFYFSNRKILRAGRNGRDVFLAVLCMNAQRDSLGFVPIADWEPEYLAHYLGIGVADAADGMSRAVTAQLLAVGADRVSVVGWDEHWGSRGQSRAEIQKAYRERKKEAESDGDSVTVTPLPQSNALPLEREIDRERDSGNSASPSSLSASPSSGASKRTGQLPDSWSPSQEHHTLAQQLGCDLTHEAAQFRAHFRGNGHRKADWNAVFEKWVRGSRDKGKPKAKPGSTTTTPRRNRQVIEGRAYVEDDNGELVPEGDEPLHAGSDPTGVSA